MTSAYCQQTTNTWTISGFDLDNSAKYNKALNTGLELYDQGKYIEAINAYDAAIRLDPNSADAWQAWNGKGDALKALGRTEESDVVYTTAKGMHTMITKNTSPSATPVTHILDHNMASKVDEFTHSPITRTYNFSTADSRAYSWLSLGNIGPGKVEWYWYSPDGSWYKAGQIDIPPIRVVAIGPPTISGVLSTFAFCMEIRGTWNSRQTNSM